MGDGKMGEVIRMMPYHQSVFLILDGPDTAEAVYEVCGSAGKYVSFRTMIGAYFRHAESQSGYVEPLLDSCVNLHAEVIAAQPEHQNPNGIALVGRFYEVPTYERQSTGERGFCAPNHEFYVPRLSVGKLFRASYDLVEHTGGFVVKSDQLLIDSRCELTRVCSNGRNVYRIPRDAEKDPTTSNLKPLRYYQDPRQDCYY